MAGEDYLFSFPLALSPSEDLSLYCSVHNGVENPNELYRQLQLSESTLGLLNATKILSLNQLIAAANIAATRKVGIPSGWEVVYNVASSTHLGHVLRDFSFSESTESSADVIVVWISTTGNDRAYKELLESFNIPKVSQAISAFLSRQAVANKDHFLLIYKLTKQEVLTSSLEAAVITRIATKMLA